MWRPVLGWEDLYEVSDKGEVRSLRSGNNLKPYVDPRGYAIVSLSRGGSQKSIRIHTLVLEAFRGKKPKGKEACHADGYNMNNNLDNLRWDTHYNNMQDREKYKATYGGRISRDEEE